jgi:3-keto-disaccharide hydrolase
MYQGIGARATAFATAAVLVVGCAHSSAMQGTDSGTMSASSASSASGWRTLFDGTSLAAFRGYKTQTMPAGWSIADGTLTKSGSVEDLVTRDKFANFELSFDWKLGPGGNSGVMYRVTEEYDHPYWSGPEYQLLDDAGHPDGKSRMTAAGSDYAVYPSPAGVVKPANEWNSSLIVVQGNRVQHWMNGQKLLEYELLSPDWEAKVKASKFGAWPNYGRAKSGYIAIQGDHDGVLSLRNIRIRELK